MATKTQSQQQMVSKATLRLKYGLTDTLIRKLGEPDDTAPNPHYRSAGAPMQLYKVSRVKRFCKRHAVAIADAKAKREGRQAAARKAVMTKTNSLLDRIRQIGLKSYDLPESFDELVKLTRCHAIERHGATCAEPGWAGICATVRHEFTNYEELLHLAEGKVGKDDAYDEIRMELDTMVLELLSEKYGDAIDK